MLSWIYITRKGVSRHPIPPIKSFSIDCVGSHSVNDLVLRMIAIMRHEFISICNLNHIASYRISES